MKSLEEIIHIVCELCSSQNAIIATYIFGSISKGKIRKSSDIDIAILLDAAHLKSFSVPSFITILEKAMACRVDVVILNRSDEVLKYEVRRTGRLIFERFPTLRKRFEIKGRKTFEDFLYLHKKYVDKVLYQEKNG